MSPLMRSLAVIGALTIPMTSTAGAWWHVRSSYYCPAPVYVMPSYPVYYGSPSPAWNAAPSSNATAPTPRNYARPEPAGPSATSKKTPTPAVKESRSYYSAYPVATPPLQKLPVTQCHVGFWNLSERDLKIVVADKVYPLARGQNLNIELPREFAWRVETREVRKERIPDSDAAVAIVIRR